MPQNTAHLIRIMGYQKRHFLSIKEVSNLLGISVSTINLQQEKGTFPTKHKPISKKNWVFKYQINERIDGKKCDR